MRVAEYIEREDVLKTLVYHRLGDQDSLDFIDVVLATAKKAVNRIPAADVVKVKHGRWRDECVVGFDKKFCTVFVCSACGKRYRTPGMNYCPNCGARMDKQEEEK